MEKKDFFLKSKIALFLNVILSIAAFLFFDISVAGLGLLVGVSFATCASITPSRAIQLSLSVLTILITLIAIGVNVWVVYPIFFVTFPLLLIITKDADRLSILGSYALGVVFPLVGIGLAVGLEKIFT